MSCRYDLHEMVRKRKTVNIIKNVTDLKLGFATDYTETVDTSSTWKAV